MSQLIPLAYNASLRMLDKQEEVVRELRSRTAVVLAVASFAVSVAGGAAIRASAPTALAAVGAALTSLSASLYVLLPQPLLRFAIDGRSIVEEHGRSADPDEVQRRLVYDLARIWRANDLILARLLAAFRVSALALSLETILLMLALRSTL